MPEHVEGTERDAAIFEADENQRVREQVVSLLTERDSLLTRVRELEEAAMSNVSVGGVRQTLQQFSDQQAKALAYRVKAHDAAASRVDSLLTEREELREALSYISKRNLYSNSPDYESGAIARSVLSSRETRKCPTCGWSTEPTSGCTDTFHSTDRRKEDS